MASLDGSTAAAEGLHRSLNVWFHSGAAMYAVNPIDQRHQHTVSSSSSSSICGRQSLTWRQHATVISELLLPASSVVYCQRRRSMIHDYSLLAYRVSGGAIVNGVQLQMATDPIKGRYALPVNTARIYGPYLRVVRIALNRDVLDLTTDAEYVANYGRPM